MQALVSQLKAELKKDLKEDFVSIHQRLDNIVGKVTEVTGKVGKFDAFVSSTSVSAWQFLNKFLIESIFLICIRLHLFTNSFQRTMDSANKYFEKKLEEEALSKLQYVDAPTKHQITLPCLTVKEVENFNSQLKDPTKHFDFVSRKDFELNSKIIIIF